MAYQNVNGEDIDVDDTPTVPLFAVTLYETRLHVEINAASDMFMDIDAEGANLHQLLASVCEVIPAILRSDEYLAEFYDSPTTVQRVQHNADTRLIAAFVQQWRGDMMGHNIAIGAFARLVL